MGSESTETPASTFPRQFGKYHLLAPLAQGGMGALYIAVTGDRGLERLLVIKTVLPHLADDEYVARFRDEAKVVVQLSHQNLIQVFEAGQVDGELFLAMDLIEGKDLRAVWNRCAKKSVAFPLDVAAFVVKELCRGLGYAHSQGDLGVVHRDVSPPNVILSYNGEVKLTDFGLAASTLKLEKTAPGIVYGKVSYMSPEQARGERLDGRSDLYTAGIILWELLTGRQLYPASADQGQDLVDRSANPEVPLPSARAPRVPPELDAICRRALAADPSERYPTGEAFREALAKWLAATHPSTDGARVERFLAKLFDEDFEAEKTHRAALLAQTRERVLTLPPSHELHQLFANIANNIATNISNDDLDRRSGAGPNLGRRAVDEGDEASDRRRVSGRRAVDKLAEGVGTMLGLQASAPQVGAAAALASQAEALPIESRTTPDSDALTGDVLDGRYRIDELLGEGGMGRVYLGEHVDIGRTVAIKVLHAVYSNMPDLVERFRREARAATKIGHPNIVDVTDSGTTADGSTYFVMEYLDGVELGSVIDKEGALEVGRALAIATQICRALAAAHAVDIIHRDLKPENVYLTTQQGISDFVKVLDFGIAKTGEAEKARERKLTSPGVAMGTPEYMAPEQAAGRPADERCDIYAVGAILYEMLSGVPPYEGDNFMEILSKKATSDPTSLLTLRPEIPTDVVTMVAQAMSREPEDRPSSMEALEYELTKLSSGRGVAVANAIGLSSEVSAASEVPRTNPPGLSSSNPPALSSSNPPALSSSNPPALSSSNPPGLRAAEPTGEPTAAETPGRLREARLDDAATEVVVADATGVTTADSISSEDSGELAPAAVAVSALPPTHPPAPFDSTKTALYDGSAAAGRAARIGWLVLLLVLTALGLALIYAVLAERGSEPEFIAADPTETPAASAGGVASPPSVLPTDAAPAGDTKSAGDGRSKGKARPAIEPAKATRDEKPDAVANEVESPDRTGRNTRDSEKDGAKGSGGQKDDDIASLFKAADAALASGKLSQAKSKYRAAMAAGGSKTKANLGLGLVAFESQRFEEAVRYGKAAGQSARALQLVGNAYFKQKNCARAVVFYRRWAARAPSSKAAKRAISLCEK